MAAADRVKLLLTVVEDDDFLSEVLTSADRSMDGFRQGLSVAGTPPGCDDPRSGPDREGPARRILGPAYHAAKKRAQDARRPAAAQRVKVTGRA